MPQPAILPPSWNDVLEQIQQSLTRILATAGEAEPATPSSVVEPPWQQDLAELPRRLHALETRAGGADRHTVEADAALQAGMDAAAAWRQKAAEVRQRLAERAGGAV